MAFVIPFRGIRYNPEKIQDPSAVVAPPFDVITPPDRDRLYQRHPRNIVRLILGRSHASDSISNNRDTRAAGCLERWISKRILIRDDLPALYLTSVSFDIDNQRATRYGLIARVRLEPFERGIILPHERTFSKVKSERLALLKACHTNFSPIFTLYPDGRSTLTALQAAVSGQCPDSDLVDAFGHRHRLWRIVDPGIHTLVADAMRAKQIFIADGHHRYETALNYRHWIAENRSDFNEQHPANFVMMSLSAMDDPGLMILPAHRMFTGVPEHIRSRFVTAAGAYFDIREISFDGASRETVQRRFIEDHTAGRPNHAIGVIIGGKSAFYILTLKPGTMKRLFANELSDSERDLDVTVLTRLILIKIMGFDHERLDNEQQVSYTTCAEAAIDAAISGQADISFLLNPTRVEQIRRIAESGRVMPRKSTYFFPKVLTGQVLNTLLS